MTDAEKFKQTQKDLYELFLKKNADYGETYKKYGIIGILIRISDKIDRCINIDKNKVHLIKEEGIENELRDLANYSTMALMLKKKEDK